MSRSAKFSLISVFALLIFGAAGAWVTNQQVKADTLIDSSSTTPSPTTSSDNATLSSIDTSATDSSQSLTTIDTGTPAPTTNNGLESGSKNCEELRLLAIQEQNNESIQDTYTTECLAVSTTADQTTISPSPQSASTTNDSVSQPRSRAPLHWTILIIDAVIVLGLLIALTARILKKVLNPTAFPETNIPGQPAIATATAGTSPNGQPKTIDDLNLDL